MIDRVSDRARQVESGINRLARRTASSKTTSSGRYETWRHDFDSCSQAVQMVLNGRHHKPSRTNASQPAACASKYHSTPVSRYRRVNRLKPFLHQFRSDQVLQESFEVPPTPLRFHVEFAEQPLKEIANPSRPLQKGPNACSRRIHPKINTLGTVQDRRLASDPGRKLP
jgi:hypothetical protein